MAVVYATLIIKGKKTIKQVPSVIREQVKEILVDMELPELTEQLHGGAEMRSLYFQESW